MIRRSLSFLPKKGNNVLYTALIIVEMWLMIRFGSKGPSTLGTGRYHFERN